MLERDNIPRPRFSPVTISLCAVLFFFGLLSYTRAEKTDDCCCRKIVKDQDTLYIRFERTSPLGNARNQEPVVWLRFINNRTCEVSLVSPGFYFRPINGVWTSAVEDGEEVNVWYKIETECSSKRHYKEDQLKGVRLLPGRTFLFPVPSRYFKKNYAVAVPFRYAWDEDASVISSSPLYEVRYFAIELPAGWEKITLAKTGEAEK